MISAIGRSPKGGPGEVRQPTKLEKRRFQAAHLFHPLQPLVGDDPERFLLSGALLRRLLLSLSCRVVSRRYDFPSRIALLPSVGQAHVRVDAECERLLPPNR